MDGVGRVDGNGVAGEAAPNARSRQRDSLFLSARLRFAGEDAVHEVRVRNLSAGGLMAEYDGRIAEGATVALEMRGLGELSGTVAWATRGRIGIALSEPIDPQRARKPVGTGARTPAFTKPVMVTRGPRR